MERMKQRGGWRGKCSLESTDWENSIPCEKRKILIDQFAEGAQWKGWPCCEKSNFGTKNELGKGGGTKNTGGNMRMRREISKLNGQDTRKGEAKKKGGGKGHSLIVGGEESSADRIVTNEQRTKEQSQSLFAILFSSPSVQPWTQKSTKWEQICCILYPSNPQKRIFSSLGKLNMTATQWWPKIGPGGDFLGSADLEFDPTLSLMWGQ